MSAEVRNYLKYALMGVVTFFFGAVAGILPQLNDPNVRYLSDINYMPVLASALTAVSLAYGASFLPRVGSAQLAQQTDKLRKKGVKRKNMVVEPKN